MNASTSTCRHVMPVVVPSARRALRWASKACLEHGVADRVERDQRHAHPGVDVTPPTHLRPVPLTEILHHLRIRRSAPHRRPPVGVSSARSEPRSGVARRLVSGPIRRPPCGRARRRRRPPAPGSDARSRRRASASPPRATAPRDRSSPNRCSSFRSRIAIANASTCPAATHHASTPVRTARTDRTPQPATGPADSRAPTTRDPCPSTPPAPTDPDPPAPYVRRTQRTSNESSQLRNSRDRLSKSATASRSAAPTSASSNTPRVSRRFSIMFTSSERGTTGRSNADESSRSRYPPS